MLLARLMLAYAALELNSLEGNSHAWVPQHTQAKPNGLVQRTRYSDTGCAMVHRSPQLGPLHLTPRLTGLLLVRLFPPASIGLVPNVAVALPSLMLLGHKQHKTMIPAGRYDAGGQSFPACKLSL